MFHRIFRLGLSPVVQTPHHRSRVLISVGELVTLKGPIPNLQPHLPKIRELVLAERPASFQKTRKILDISNNFFRKDDEVHGAVTSLVVALVDRKNKTVGSQHNVCRFISECGQLRDAMPVSACDFFSTILLENRNKNPKTTSCSKWVYVLFTFARASYNPASPVIAYIAKELIEKLNQPGCFIYLPSVAATIAHCVAVYPTPLFIGAVQKVVTPHVVKDKQYRTMEKLFDSGCLTAKDIKPGRLPYHSPLFSKMVLTNVELTAVWMIGRSYPRSERMADRRVQKSNFCTPRQSKSIESIITTEHNKKS